jgi:hypothetical protein
MEKENGTLRIEPKHRYSRGESQEHNPRMEPTTVLDN